MSSVCSTLTTRDVKVVLVYIAKRNYRPVGRGNSRGGFTTLRHYGINSPPLLAQDGTVPALTVAVDTSSCTPTQLATVPTHASIPAWVSSTSNNRLFPVQQIWKAQLRGPTKSKLRPKATPANLAYLGYLNALRIRAFTPMEI
jgi:hypothetical protein